MNSFAYITAGLVLCVTSMSAAQTPPTRQITRTPAASSPAPAPNSVDLSGRATPPFDSYGHRLLTQPRLGDHPENELVPLDRGVPASAPSAPETDMLPP